MITIIAVLLLVGVVTGWYTPVFVFWFVAPKMLVNAAGIDAISTSHHFFSVVGVVGVVGIVGTIAAFEYELSIRT